MVRKMGLIGLILGLLLVGCATENLAESLVSTPIITPTETAVSTSEPQGIIAMPSTEEEIESVGNDEPVIIYSQTGGFAGLERVWNIYADGRIENGAGELVGMAEAEEITAVLTLADEVNFYELDDAYLNGDDCCDLFTYTLTITHNEQVKTVTTRDNSPYPSNYEVVLTAVNDLIYDNPITE